MRVLNFFHKIDFFGIARDHSCDTYIARTHAAKLWNALLSAKKGRKGKAGVALRGAA